MDSTDFMDWIESDPDRAAELEAWEFDPDFETDLEAANDMAHTGWFEELIEHPDGTVSINYLPLTEEEFLHPREGCRLPNSTFHDDVVADARALLSDRYADRPDVGVFHDVLIRWDRDLKNHCPDVQVIFGLKDKERHRKRWHVQREGGVRPIFILEVVSPRYRKTDREKKVIHYAIAGVQEYGIVDRRRVKNRLVDEVLGYRLVDDHYQPITPDSEGRIGFQTLGVWMSMQQGKLVLEDMETGDRLLRLEEARARMEQERSRADQERERADRLAAYLRSQGIDPTQI